MGSITRIFLSYAREDREIVESLYDFLLGEGYKPWMDIKDILPGENWERCLFKAIRQSDFFIACLSTNSVNKRGFVQKELKQALDIAENFLDDDIFIIPVRLNNCIVPEKLSNRQWMDLNKTDGKIQLIKSIQAGILRRQNNAVSIQDSTGLHLSESTIIEDYEGPFGYEIDLIIPELLGLNDSKSQNELNYLLKAFAIGNVLEAREFRWMERVFPSSTRPGLIAPEYPDYLGIRYRVSLMTDKFVSLALTITTFYDAAHPSYEICVFNYALSPLIPLTLKNIFKNDSSYLEVIASFCNASLIEQREKEGIGIDDYDYEVLHPKSGNFSKFNITDNGLIIFFNPLEVGAYAWGIREVFVPFEKISDLMNPDFKKSLMSKVPSN
jgi:hypothetical protein